jgi:YD repeat-containing protein
MPDRSGPAVWRTDSRRCDRLELDDTGRAVVHLDHERRLRFGAAGALDGWNAGAATVTVERSDGRIVRLREEYSGRSVDVGWDGALISSLTASDGRTVIYDRDESGRLTSVASFAGTLHYAWDGNLLLSVTDDDGVAAFVNDYDEGGRVIRQVSPFGRITTYAYQVPGATVIADERGVRQAMVHDARGNLTAVIDVDGSAMRITYDDADRAVRVVSRSGAEWRYDFDEVTGDLLTRHDPDGLRQSWTWDALARPLTDTDRTGATTTFEYQGTHRTPVKVIGPDGATATAELDEAGRTTRITDADGVVRNFEWDRDGQLSQVTDAHGAKA